MSTIYIIEKDYAKKIINSIGHNSYNHYIYLMKHITVVSCLQCKKDEEKVLYRDHYIINNPEEYVDFIVNEYNKVKNNFCTKCNLLFTIVRKESVCTWETNNVTCKSRYGPEVVMESDISEDEGFSSDDDTEEEDIILRVLP